MNYEYNTHRQTNSIDEVVRCYMEGCRITNLNTGDSYQKINKQHCMYYKERKQWIKCNTIFFTLEDLTDTWGITFVHKIPK